MITTSPSRDAVFDALADPRRRTLLALLREHQQPISECELAARIVARETDRPREEVSEEERRRAFTDLYHSQLPRLTEANLIVRDRDRETVSIASHPVLEHDLSGVLRSHERSEQADDSVFESLANQRRRHVVAVLDGVNQPIPLTDLTERVAARTDGGESDDTDAALERIRVSLYHVDLPKLADAGLVDYDTDRQLVTGREPPAWYRT